MNCTIAVLLAAIAAAATAAADDVTASAAARSQTSVVSSSPGSFSQTRSCCSPAIKLFRKSLLDTVLLSTLNGVKTRISSFSRSAPRHCRLEYNAVERRDMAENESLPPVTVDTVGGDDDAGLELFDAVVGLWLPAVLATFGVVGNALSLWVLSSDPAATATLASLKALALSDLVLLGGVTLAFHQQMPSSEVGYPLLACTDQVASSYALSETG